ncbi:uncharacterized protein PV09_06117 [Verruconis gallopava]|uniref:Uncharacterized protein n=1 Tax=Verruconis gallopava TaxID=253628 RepID=A0A0D2A7X3_9PEZI|nr:uncharacterized protein PV09_06117 [Verruconis gallopava]KIW02680.1 hypothetical protein PV09_06117 [Verruconis gallopava]
MLARRQAVKAHPGLRGIRDDRTLLSQPRVSSAKAFPTRCVHFAWLNETSLRGRIETEINASGIETALRNTAVGSTICKPLVLYDDLREHRMSAMTQMLDACVEDFQCISNLCHPSTMDPLNVLYCACGIRVDRE